MDKKIFPAIDIAKLLFSYCVIGLHTGFLLNYTYGFFIHTMIFRLAVPFFFCAAGYFLGQKTTADNKSAVLLKYIKKLLFPYLLWNLFYVPYALYTNNSFNLPSLLDGIWLTLIGESRTVMWFAGCLILCVLIMLHIKNEKKLPFILLGFLVLYYIGMVFNTYNYAFSSFPMITDTIRWLTGRFSSNSNALFCGFLFFGTGYCLAKYPQIIARVTFSMRIFIIVVSFIVLLAESIITKEHLDSVGYYGYFLIHPILVPMLFLFLRDIPFPQIKTNTVRVLSNYIFYVHFAVIYGVLELIEAYSSFFMFQGSVGTYLLVSVISTAICLLYIWIKRNMREKHIKSNPLNFIGSLKKEQSETVINENETASKANTTENSTKSKTVDENKVQSSQVPFTIKTLFVYEDKISFIAALITGIIAHLYIYTNIYLGHDTFSFYLAQPGWDIVTGRFVGTWIKQLHGSLLTPWLIGMITLIFFALSAVLICRTMQIKKPIFLITVSAAVVTWPTVTAIHAFHYMAAQFGFALLTACFAAFLTNRYRYGFIFGILLLVVSMACYQSYWGMCAALLLLCLIKDIMSSKNDNKKIIVKCVMFAGTLITGFLIYYGLWNYTIDLSGLSRPDYIGMDSIGYNSMAEILTVVINSYRRVFEFFFIPNVQSYYPVYLMMAGCFCILLALYLIFRQVIKEKMLKQPVRAVLLILCFALLPLAINITELFSKSVSTTVLSYFGFLLPILLLPLVLSFQEKLRDGRLQKIYIGVAVMTLIFSCVNGIYGANITYLKLESNWQIASSQISQYMGRIISEDGYKADTPIAIIWNQLPPERAGFEWTRDIKGAPSTALSYAHSVRQLTRALNPGINILDDVTPYENLSEVTLLNSFPAHDCVLWINDTLILKLS